LINAWGIGLSPTTGAFWVSDNGTGKTTLYVGDVAGSKFANAGLVVSGLGNPTGQVFNPTTDFKISAGGATAAAVFIFVSEDGSITAWNPGVPPPGPSTQAQVVVPASNAVFKGVTIATNTIGSKTGNFLYAADFRDNKVDVFDGTFKATTLDGTFTDPTLPAGFAPFNVENLNGKLYVTFAKQDAAMHDDVRGPGNGFVDVFDTSGKFLQRLVSNGNLNSPWGLAIAPAGFGGFGGDLLVGNFGDGHVNAYDPTTGTFAGTLKNTDGDILTIDGLWGLTFGNGVTAGDKSTLYFTAGPGGENHGLFGSLKASTEHLIAVGSNAGGVGTVDVFGADAHNKQFSLMPFGPNFKGEVRVATGDINGDGIPDIAVGTGPGAPTQVAIFDGATQKQLFSIQPFEASFTGGVFVSMGDLNGDGVPDLAISPDQGGGPRVRVFDGKTLTQIADFFGIDDPNFRGGARTAIGDLNGDGKGDLIVAAGFGGGPRIAAFDGAQLTMTGGPKLFGDFFAFEPTLRNGAFVAAGDLNGDGKADLVTGGGPSGGPRVQILSGADLVAGGTQTVLANFFAGDPNTRGGVRVAVANLAAGGPALIVGDGTGVGSAVTAYLSKDLTPTGTPPAFYTFDAEPGFSGGVFVG
jgi:uncharacterized protein (TIGR03118 family)